MKIIIVIFSFLALIVKSIGFLDEYNLLELKRRLAEEDNKESLEEKNEKEKIRQASCANYKDPESLNDCKKIDAKGINGRDHSCCFFQMSEPKKLNTCVPVEIIFLPVKNLAVTLKFPGNIYINGNVTCYNLGLLYISYLLLLILIF